MHAVECRFANTQAGFVNFHGPNESLACAEPKARSYCSTKMKVIVPRWSSRAFGSG